MLDSAFSKAYPHFVTGEGWDAEVVVSQEQLDLMCDASVALLRWLAMELDRQDQSLSASPAPKPRQSGGDLPEIALRCNRS